MMGGPLTHFPIVDALNDVLFLLEKSNGQVFSVLEVLSASQQLVNGFNYVFTMKLVSDDCSDSCTYQITYYTGPFPILAGSHGRITEWKQISSSRMLRVAQNSMPGEPLTDFPILQGLNGAIAEMNKKGKYAVSQILSASQQLVNGLSFKFTFELRDDSGNSVSYSNFYVAYYTGPFANPNPEIDLFLQLKDSNPEVVDLSSNDPNIASAKSAIAEYLKQIKLSTKMELAEERINSILVSKLNDGDLLHVNAILEGVNVNCIECEDFWILAKADTPAAVLYTEEKPFPRDS
jgi:hypothetical protein